MLLLFLFTSRQDVVYDSYDYMLFSHWSILQMTTMPGSWLHLAPQLPPSILPPVTSKYIVFYVVDWSLTVDALWMVQLPTDTADISHWLVSIKMILDTTIIARVETILYICATLSVTFL